ncbi:MAG: YabP/YqfC family sporulation protein [Coprococcus sp.]|nr:YabP/YqfC family sporulation protein [Coprococcus sp.]
MNEKIKNIISFEPPCWSPDVSAGTSKITMYNNDELIIENFRHVIYSDEDKISVKTRKGVLNIYGTCLKIRHYVCYEIRITGKISGIDWLVV